MLTFLNLTANPLSKMVVGQNGDAVFSNITHLVLNKTKVPWDTIEALLQSFSKYVGFCLYISFVHFPDKLK